MLRVEMFFDVRCRRIGMADTYPSPHHHTTHAHGRSSSSSDSGSGGSSGGARDDDSDPLAEARRIMDKCVRFWGCCFVVFGKGEQGVRKQWRLQHAKHLNILSSGLTTSKKMQVSVILAWCRFFVGVGTRARTPPSISFRARAAHQNAHSLHIAHNTIDHIHNAFSYTRTQRISKKPSIKKYRKQKPTPKTGFDQVVSA
jgi:hypothetical protein